MEDPKGNATSVVNYFINYINKEKNLRNISKFSEAKKGKRGESLSFLKKKNEKEFNMKLVNMDYKSPDKNDYYNQQIYRPNFENQNEKLNISTNPVILPEKEQDEADLIFSSNYQKLILEKNQEQYIVNQLLK